MSAPREPFGARLAAALETYGQLCVGIDPHPGLLTQWGLGEDPGGLREFGQRVVAAAEGRVGVVKTQVAFFENHGPAGMAALAEIIAAAKDAGLLVIADAKRSDIGSTMAAYAEAWLNPEKFFGADALTVSPYLGFGSLTPAVEAAERYHAGLFVLALTSNPEGRQVQLARNEHQVAGVVRSRPTVAAQIAAAAQRINDATSRAFEAPEPGRQPASIQQPDAHRPPLGHIGLVVGATTVQLAGFHGIDLRAGRPPLLAPGYGAQGATAEQMRTSFGPAWPQVLVNSSRGILQHGPQMSDLVAAIEASLADLR